VGHGAALRFRDFLGRIFPPSGAALLGGVTWAVLGPLTSAITMGRFILTQRTRTLTCFRRACISAWTFFLAISLTLSSLGLGHDNGPGRDSEASAGPARSVDLRLLGYPRSLSKRETWALYLSAPVSFSDDSTVIASFLTPADGTTLARRGQPNSPLPMKLHGVFLEATTGEVRATREWLTGHPAGGVVAASGGRFTVLTSGAMALYSPNLELLKKVTFSSEQESHLWNFYPSPSGRSVLLEYHNPETSFQWVDVSSFQPGRIWKGSLGGVSISDHEIAFSKESYTAPEGVTHEILLQALDGYQQALCRVRLGYDSDIGCGTPEFISDEVLALWNPHRFSLILAAGGGVLFTAGFRQDEWIGPRLLRPSADGKRLAVAVSAHKGGSEILDIDYHSVLKRIMVFDIPNRQCVYTLDAKKQKIKTISGLALSPDGSLMAILEDGIVEVYRLPATEPRSALAGTRPAGVAASGHPF
jgi:hypothetical protein